MVVSILRPSRVGGEQLGPHELPIPSQSLVIALRIMVLGGCLRFGGVYISIFIPQFPADEHTPHHAAGNARLLLTALITRCYLVIEPVD